MDQHFLVFSLGLSVNRGEAKLVIVRLDRLKMHTQNL